MEYLIDFCEFIDNIEKQESINKIKPFEFISVRGKNKNEKQKLLLWQQVKDKFI